LSSVGEEFPGVKFIGFYESLVSGISIFLGLDVINMVLVVQDAVHITSGETKVHVLFLFGGETSWKTVSLLRHVGFGRLESRVASKLSWRKSATRHS